MNAALLILTFLTLVSAAAAPPACLLACVARETQKQTQCSSLNQVRCICQSLSVKIVECLNESCPSDSKKAIDKFTETCKEFGVIGNHGEIAGVVKDSDPGLFGSGNSTSYSGTGFSATDHSGSHYSAANSSSDPGTSATTMTSTADEPTITPTAGVHVTGTETGQQATASAHSYSNSSTTSTTFLSAVTITSYVESTQTLAAATVTPSLRVVATTAADASASNQALVLGSLPPVYLLFCVIIIIYK